METVTVILGLSDLSDMEVLERGRNHVTMLTGNPNFPAADLVPSLVEQAALCDAFEASITECLFNGGKVAFNLKRTRRAALYLGIKQLAGHVQANCDNDPDKVLSTGFTFRKVSTRIDKVEMPTNLRVLNGTPGTVPLRWDPAKGAENYIVFINTSPKSEEEAWELLAYTSRASYLATELETARFYGFRVQAMARKGLLSAMSEQVRALVP